MAKSFLSHLECSRTGETFEADRLQNLSPAGAPLLARYDAERLRREVTSETFSERRQDFWRYRELLPVREDENVTSLGEVITPLIPLTGSAGPNVLVKDEGRLPTGSFKARGLSVAVSRAKELGASRIALPTNGNAGAAAAAYATRAGLESFVFCPDDTPQVNIRETALQGGKVWTVNGLIDDCGKIVAAGEEAMGWFNVATLREPYRVEGKKTMGIELAEQLGWQLPDVILYPTGGGTGLIGMWKAFEELEAIGLIGPKRPRMVAVQSTGCAPIVRAWETNSAHAEKWNNADTAAAGIRVPVVIGDFLILNALRDSDGFAIAVEEEAIFEARRRVGSSDGLLMCPEGAATLAGYFAAREKGLIDPAETAILFNCGNGLKYPMPDEHGTVDQGSPPDWSQF
jgi:threonine synthase